MKRSIALTCGFGVVTAVGIVPRLDDSGTERAQPLCPACRAPSGEQRATCEAHALLSVKNGGLANGESPDRRDGAIDPRVVLVGTNSPPPRLRQRCCSSAPANHNSRLRRRQAARPQTAPRVEVQRQVKQRLRALVSRQANCRRFTDSRHRLARTELEHFSGDGMDLRIAQDGAEHLLGRFEPGVELGQTDPVLTLPAAPASSSWYLVRFCYSAPSVISGSICAARAAGTEHAIIAPAVSPSDTKANVMESCAVTPNRRPEISRVDKSAPAPPRPTPVTTTTSVYRNTIASTLRGCAPRAIRRPISCVR